MCSLTTAPCPLHPQVFSMFVPDVNLRNKSAWHKDGDVPDMSLDDSQVRETEKKAIVPSCS